MRFRVQLTTASILTISSPALALADMLPSIGRALPTVVSCRTKQPFSAAAAIIAA